MRQFIQGIIFGAVCVYGWTYYGHYFVDFKNYTMAWKEGAVSDTKGYGVSRDADATKRHNR